MGPTIAPFLPLLPLLPLLPPDYASASPERKPNSSNPSCAGELAFPFPGVKSSPIAIVFSSGILMNNGTDYRAILAAAAAGLCQRITWAQTKLK